MTDEIKVNQETRMLARQICQWVTVFHGRKLEDMIAKAIGRREQATRIAAENAALERAARMADKIAQCANTSGRSNCCESLGEDIADDIRALKTKASE